jgi:xylulokinase
LRSDLAAGTLARAAFEGVVCGLLDALDALGAAGVDASGRLLLVGGGARSLAYRRIVADLAQRSATVPHADELVATGACVQAAAVLQRRTPEEIARAWRLGAGEAIKPDPGVDAATVRAAYARARDAL